MEPINSVTSSPVFDFRTVNSIQFEALTPLSENLPSNELNQSQSVISDLVDQLPQEPAQGVLDIFREINILSVQAAEPGQSIENRETLQIGVSDQILSLVELLEQINQDELDLFIALFQNQSINFSAESDLNSNLLSGLSPFDVADNSLERLLQIDLRTEQGILFALDFSSNILSSLSIFETDSDFLENFLEDLIDISISNSLLEILSSEQEGTDTSDTEQAQTISEPNPPLTSPNGDPPTIIELAG